MHEAKRCAGLLSIRLTNLMTLLVCVPRLISKIPTVDHGDIICELSQCSGAAFVQDAVLKIVIPGAGSVVQLTYKHLA